MVHPGTASAQVDTTPIFTDLRANPTTSSYLNDFYSKILADSERSAAWNSTASTWTNAERNVVYRATYNAGAEARLLPALDSALLLRLGLVGVSAYIGFRVWQHYHGGTDRHFDMWLDSGVLGKDSLYNPCSAPPGGNCPPAMGWAGAPSGTANTDQTGKSFNDDSYSKEWGAAWVYSPSSNNSNGGCSTSISGVSAPCYVLHLNPYGYDVLADSRVGASNTCDASNATWGDYSSCWLSWADADSLSSTPYGPAMGWAYGNSSQAGWASTWPQQLGYAVEQTQIHAHDHIPGALRIRVGETDIGLGSGPGVSVGRYKVLMSAADMHSLIGEAWDPGHSTSDTPDETQDYTVPTTYNAPGDTGTATDTNNALDALDSPCGRALVQWIISGSGSFNPSACGGWTQVATFPLLQPLVNETYSDYLDRLRAAGWLGTATSTEATEAQALPEMGPEGVARVSIGANTYVPGHWPGTLPHWNVNTNLNVLFNPADTPEAPGGGEVPPDSGDDVPVSVPPGDPTGAVCDCPPIDFSPITDADVGDKFPFAIIGWVSGWVGALVGDPTAPEFDFSNPAWGSTHYDVNLNVMDDYAATIRTLIAWAMWIGAIWWFGSRLLGFNATGDPGEAVDDAW